MLSNLFYYYFPVVSVITANTIQNITQIISKKSKIADFSSIPEVHRYSQDEPKNNGYCLIQTDYDTTNTKT